MNSEPRSPPSRVPPPRCWDRPPTWTPPLVRQFFRIIDEQADHMNDLVADLLDVARIETGTLPVTPGTRRGVCCWWTEPGAPSPTPAATNLCHQHRSWTCPWCWRTAGAWCRCWATSSPTRPATRPPGSTIRVNAAYDTTFTWPSRYPTREGGFLRKTCRCCFANSPAYGDRGTGRGYGAGAGHLQGHR